MKLGVYVPQGWSGELAAGPEGPGEAWRQVVESARLAEELGYDSIWLGDHLHPIGGDLAAPVFECWTTLAALAGETSRVRLGQMATCALYRSPALLAKVASTVDVLSEGRLFVGIGAGWYEEEARAYGYAFPRLGDRLGMLSEAVEILGRMWNDPVATFEGRWFAVQAARCEPKPLQRPGPPLWVAGSGERRTLRLVAERADYCNVAAGPEEWSRKVDVLRAHCRDVGRDPDEIGLTWSGGVVVRETRAELDELWRAGRIAPRRRGTDLDEWLGRNIVGTVEDVAARLQDLARRGCTYAVCWLPDYPEHESLRLLAERVRPALAA